MPNRKHTLPRHTSLAKQGSRVGAFLFDSLLFLVGVITLFATLFALIFNPIVKPVNKVYVDEQINTGLMKRNGETSLKLDGYKAEPEEYLSALDYFYLHYMNNENISEGKEGSKINREEKYTVKFINETLLGIKDDATIEEEQNIYFTYKVVDGNVDKTQVGTPKLDAKKEDVLRVLQTAYVDALNVFNKQDYVIKMVDDRNFILSIQLVLSSLTSGAIFYIIVPFAFGDGISFGKKLFGLALTNKDGYKVEKWRVALRFAPLGVITLSLLIPIWKDIIILGIVFLSLFIISWALMMASPTKSSLHDYVGGTLVVDAKSTIIFKDSEEEEAYLFKEDGIVDEEEKVDE